MPDDAKTKLDRTSRRKPDPTTFAAITAVKAGKTHNNDRRQPPQPQQRDTTGTTLPDPNETSTEYENQTGGA